MFTRILLAIAAIVAVTALPSAQTDLDSLMSQVLERRDENWKKLQQYTLREENTFRLLGPMEAPLFGARREYDWVPREGFFVRSPVSADGVAVNEADRKRAEDMFLIRSREREKRRAERAKETADPTSTPANPIELQDLFLQTVEPEFVRTAYFLEFKFERGHYALVGREQLLGRNVLRIEYYPEQLFRDEKRDDDAKSQEASKEQSQDRQTSRQSKEGARITRQMNKVSLVTLWVEPTDRQILKYEFDNIDTDFLPGRSIVRLDELKASMQMGQPFPGVWLPDSVAMRFALTLAIGRISARYDVTYRDYRKAEVDIRVIIP